MRSERKAFATAARCGRVTVRRFIGPLVAIGAGMLPTFLLLAALLSDPVSSETFVEEMLTRIGVVLLAHGFVALPFGLARPARGARWGLLVAAPAIAIGAFATINVVLTLARHGVAGGGAVEIALLLAFFPAAVIGAMGGAGLGSWARRRAAVVRQAPGDE